MNHKQIHDTERKYRALYYKAKIPAVKTMYHVMLIGLNMMHTRLDSGWYDKESSFETQFQNVIEEMSEAETIDFTAIAL